MYERLTDGQMRCLVHRGSESEDFVSANQPNFFRLFDVVDFENHVTGCECATENIQSSAYPFRPIQKAL